MMCKVRGCYRVAILDGYCGVHSAESIIYEDRPAKDTPYENTAMDLPIAQEIFNQEVEEAVHEDPAPDSDPFDSGGESGGAGVGGDY